jgi:hypothetical protein
MHAELDRRVPATNHDPPAAASSAQVPDGLDWRSFAAASFPGRRRHDLEALTAYSAYRRSRAADTGSSQAPAGIETGQDLTGVTSLRNWEDEGGATLSPEGR